MTKVHILGWREGVGQQADRIEEGFRAIGWEVTPRTDDADLVFANDSGSFAQVIGARDAVQGKVIFNQLDLAPHLGAAFPLARIKEQLAYADTVTTISTAVQADLRARAGVEATVVYNPIRAVTRDRAMERKHPALFVGRVNDGAKRAALGASALAILGYGWDDMLTVGREPPHYGGVYFGEATDAQLSGLYNGSTFLICPTRHAFLGLPILEAMACGTIPVVCNDLDVRAEFLPSSVFPEYDEVEPMAPSIARFVARFMRDNDARAEFSERVYRHYAAHWAERLSPAGVARAIVGVYESL